MSKIKIPIFVERDDDDDDIIETVAPEKQKLQIKLDKKHRGGKEVTLILGFKGTEEDMEQLAKTLKSKCGVGGTAKDGEIVLQGDHRTKVLDYLQKNNYKLAKVI